MQTSSPAIACDLNVFGAAERKQHVAHGEHLLRTAEISELPDGYRLRYHDRPGIVAELGSFIELDRRCCGFLTFQLHVQPAGGPVDLMITGSPEAKAGLAAGFDLMKRGVPGEEVVRRLNGPRP